MPGRRRTYVVIRHPSMQLCTIDLWGVPLARTPARSYTSSIAVMSAIPFQDDGV